jgi:hypothetical protein
MVCETTNRVYFVAPGRINKKNEGFIVKKNGK